MTVTSWQPPVARGKRVFHKVSKNILVIALVWLTLCFKPSLNEIDGLKKKVISSSLNCSEIVNRNWKLRPSSFKVKVGAFHTC